MAAQKAMVNLSELEKTKMMKETGDIYVAVAKHLAKKLPINNTFVQDVTAIDPLNRTSVSAAKIKRLAYKMCIPDKTIDSIVDEIPGYRTDPAIENIIDASRVRIKQKSGDYDMDDDNRDT